MTATPITDRRVGELVTEDFRRAGVFKRYGIDFCCGGGISLQEACARLQLDVDEVSRALLESQRERGVAAGHRFSSWTPSFLIDYIVNEHHTFVRENLPVIGAFTAKVARVHGPHTPELVEIARLFAELTREMEAHMANEEEIVFPRIKAGSGEDLAALIEQMEGEHEGAGELMHRLRRLTNDFQPPEGACNTYRASFAKLEEFEADLHTHVHLENNILFPKAIALEQQAAA
jgi:regulator of cell morphogenesis and NO signaling